MAALGLQGNKITKYSRSEAIARFLPGRFKDDLALIARITSPLWLEIRSGSRLFRADKHSVETYPDLGLSVLLGCGQGPCPVCEERSQVSFRRLAAVKGA